MVCTICKDNEAAFEISGSKNDNPMPLCGDCVVPVVRWAQGIAEWDNSRGDLPFTEKEQVAFLAPIDQMMVQS
jgi:hypothetical protein